MDEGQKEQRDQSNEARANSVKGILIKPEEARKRLEDMGYEEKDWKMFITETEQGLGSHFLRSLAHIANGSEPRNLDDVYREFYPEKPSGLPLKENTKLYKI